MLSRLDRASAALTVITYGLLVFGASVRVHGAGLACPDWPLCFGQIIPPIDLEVGFEFGHRVLAGSVSIGFLALSFAVIRRARTSTSQAPIVLVGLASAALVVQIVLGGLTVLHLLAEWTVTSHLLAGNLFCLLLLLLTLTLHREVRPSLVRHEVNPIERALAGLLAVLVPAQLAVGGLVSSTYAGLACGTWPTCDGVTWFPTLSGPVGLQVIHRLTAYALLLTALMGAVAGLARGWRGNVPGRAAVLVLSLVLLQASIGVANVWLHTPVEVTLLHTAGAAAVVLSTTWWNYEVWMAKLTVRAPSAGLVQTLGAEHP